MIWFQVRFMSKIRVRVRVKDRVNIRIALGLGYGFVYQYNGEGHAEIFLRSVECAVNSQIIMFTFYWCVYYR